jgi:hypothetical protein
MIDLNREQLRRDCSDALEALLQRQSLNGITALADAIRALGATYRAHGEQIQAAAWAREDNTVTWHLIHVVEKLEERCGIGGPRNDRNCAPVQGSVGQEVSGRRAGRTQLP